MQIVSVEMNFQSYLFLRKTEQQNNINLSSAEYVQRVVKVIKHDFLSSHQYIDLHESGHVCNVSCKKTVLRANADNDEDRVICVFLSEYSFVS